MIIIKQGSSIALINVVPYFKYRVKQKLFNNNWFEEREKLKKRFVEKTLGKDSLNKKYSELTSTEKTHIVEMEKQLCLREAVEECRIMEDPRQLDKDYE